MTLTISLSLLLLISVAHILLSILYYLSPTFLPYHAQAMEKDWESIGKPVQILFLVSLRLIAAGALMSGLAGAILAIVVFSQGYTPFIWLAILSTFIFQATLNFAVYKVYTQTQGEPSIKLVTGISSLFLAAIVLLVVYLV